MALEGRAAARPSFELGSARASGRGRPRGARLLRFGGAGGANARTGECGFGVRPWRGPRSGKAPREAAGADDDAARETPRTKAPASSTDADRARARDIGGLATWPAGAWSETLRFLRPAAPGPRCGACAGGASMMGSRRRRLDGATRRHQRGGPVRVAAMASRRLTTSRRVVHGSDAGRRGARARHSDTR